MPNIDKTTIRVQPCRERIVRTDFIAVAFNQDKLGVGGGKKRLVDLACGHKALTSSWRTAECPRCTEMLRRSIETGEEDHEHVGRVHQ